MRFNTSQLQKEALKNAGFTLIELMVALTLFTVVTLAAVSSLYTVNSASRKVEAMRNVLDNLNFAVDAMSRTIRTGSQIDCYNSVPAQNAPLCRFDANGTSPSDHLSVKGTLGEGYSGDIYFHLVDKGGDGCATRCEIWRSKNGEDIPITAPEINVKKLQFYTMGTDDATKQSGVLILIQGVATTTTDSAPFAIQTYVSQRSTK